MHSTVEHPAGEAERLVAHAGDYTGHDLSCDDIREAQVAAIDERLQQRIDKIKLVEFRAGEAGIDEIASFEDLVPLLLPHTAYKSYPERFLIDKRWDRLTKWLETVSTHSLGEVDLAGISGIDEWVDRLAKAGHYLSCSSGTTGNPAMLMSSKADAEFSAADAVRALLWGSGIKAAQDRRMFGFSMMTATPKGAVMGGASFRAFANPDRERFSFPVPPVTVGAVTRMIALRKAIADGTARPGDVAEYEAESATRQQTIDEAIMKCADAVIAARGDRIMISGMWGVIHPIAQEVRNRGYSAKDFHPENAIYLAGGLKRAVLPADYREFVFETFNIKPPFIYHMYGMQEIQTAMPRCQEGGRYHVPPWLICLPLDKAGERLLPGIGSGTVEGRAAFFDLSIDGRWGGVISGDHIQIDYGQCACGARSPSIADTIVRYADLQGDDKIACSGTIDAYVRGIS